MPVDIITHEDGSRTIVETSGDGYHHIFLIETDGAGHELGVMGSNYTRQDVIENYTLAGDTNVEPYEGIDKWPVPSGGGDQGSSDEGGDGEGGEGGGGEGGGGEAGGGDGGS